MQLVVRMSPHKTMSAPANSISTATWLVFSLGVVDPLQVEGVTARFFAFVDEEDGTIMQDFGSVSVARGKQRERIRFLQSALNNVYLHPSTTAASSDFIRTVLLADGGDDDDEDDVDDLGRLHSVTIARFDNNDDDDDEDGGDDDDDKD